MKDKFARLASVLALVIALGLALGVVYYIGLQAEEAVERSYNTSIYFEQGGAKQVVGSGGEIEIQSGATLDVQSGATATFADLYPLGYATTGSQLVYGTDTITTTGTASHGLSTVTWALCSLAEDPGTGAGDAAHCSVSVAANTVTIKTWQDDIATATVGASVNWLVIGTP